MAILAAAAATPIVKEGLKKVAGIVASNYFTDRPVIRRRDDIVSIFKKAGIWNEKTDTIFFKTYKLQHGDIDNRRIGKDYSDVYGRMRNAVIAVLNASNKAQAAQYFALQIPNVSNDAMKNAVKVLSGALAVDFTSTPSNVSDPLGDWLKSQAGLNYDGSYTPPINSQPLPDDRKSNGVMTLIGLGVLGFIIKKLFF